MLLSRFQKHLVGAFFALSLFASPAFPEPAVKNDTRYALEVEGAGDVTYFIPGLTSSPRHFAAALESPLAGEARWITLAGFAGLPPAEPTESFVEAAVDAIANDIVAEDLRGIQIVGHSLGGVMALLLAERLPDRIDAVLIVDSVPFLPALFQPGITEAMAKSQADATRNQMSNMPREAFLGMMRQGLQRQATTLESQAEVFKDIEASDQTSIAVAMSDLMATDYSPRLKNISVPVTVLIPHNQFIGVEPDALRERYKALYAGLETGQFDIIEDSRHFIMLDQPAAFEAALKSFLEANDG